MSPKFILAVVTLLKLSMQILLYHRKDIPHGRAAGRLGVGLGSLASQLFLALLLTSGVNTSAGDHEWVAYGY